MDIDYLLKQNGSTRQEREEKKLGLGIVRI